MIDKEEYPILAGLVCPYCGRKTELIDSAEIYHGKTYGWMYICRPCDAYVGCKTGKKESLGRLANAELRKYKQAAHDVFDLIWQDNHISRTEAYTWLSQQLGLDRDFTHMGMFNVDQCKQVIELAYHYLISVNEHHYRQLLKPIMDNNLLENKKTKFKEMILSTHREGAENVIAMLEELGFFKAPASTKFHLNYEGGLLEHSLNVCEIALELRELMIRKKDHLLHALPVESVIIAALLHDVCKADIYKATVKKQKNADGVWCDVPGYDVDYSNFPMGHGEKSVIVLLKNGLKLTDDEIVAIRWHMTPWDLPFQSYEMKSSLNAAREYSPLLAIIQAADGLAANILER
jgi:HD superfamily phosphohydrolase YqeK